MTKLKKIGLAAFAAFAFAGVALAQTTGGFWGNWPIVGSASYSCGSVNSVSTCTVPAGPTVVTGTETIPANTGLSGGQSPQNVLLTLASLNALPVQVQTIVPAPAVAGATPISASNLSGGIIYNSPSTITAANITLPPTPIDGQQYLVSSNRTITTLSVSAGGGTNSMAGNTAPTVLTASTTAPQGYRFRFNSALTSWFRVQ